MEILRTRPITVLAGCPACLPAASLAGEVEPAASDALRAGQRVRIETGAGAREGRFVAVQDGYVVLDRPVARVPVEPVSKVLVNGRATKRGAIVGAAVGAVALGLVGAGAAEFACEDACEGGEWAVGGAQGVLIGGGAGAVTGGLIGAALPQWHGLHRAGGAPLDGRVGSLSLGFGYDKALESLAPNGGSGGRLRLNAELGPVAPGLEIGRYGLGRRQVTTTRGQGVDYHESVVFAGPNVVVGSARGRLRTWISWASPCPADRSGRQRRGRRAAPLRAGAVGRCGRALAHELRPCTVVRVR